MRNGLIFTLCRDGVKGSDVNAPRRKLARIAPTGWPAGGRPASDIRPQTHGQLLSSRPHGNSVPERGP
jgi:hypothetical protein